MANARQEDKSTQGMEDAARRASESSAEQTSRVGQAVADQTSRAAGAAAETTEEVARASSMLLKQNVETLQNAWRFGLEAATSLMGRSTEQFGRTLGFSGEGLEEATERSTRNSKALLHTGAVAAKTMDEVSREYFQMVRHQIEKNMDRMNQLWTCRTPQDFTAVQTDMMRETVETAIESSRKIADMSVKMAEETGKQIKRAAG
jgi:phasin family protein